LSGWADIDYDMLARVTLEVGATNYSSSWGCADGVQNGDYEVNITCPVTLPFHADAGVWYITAEVSDMSGNHTSNNTASFTINALDYVSSDVVAFNWAGNLNVGVDNQEASNTITITNEGNQDYSIFNVKGQNATGQTYAEILTTDKFSIDSVTSSVAGIHLVDNTDVNMSSILNLNSHGASETEEVFAYVDVPLGIQADTYLTGTSWGINLG